MSSLPSHARDRVVNAEPVFLELPRPRPERRVLDGQWVSMEPLDADRHAGDMYPLFHGDATKEAVWDYLPYGPFATEGAYADWVREVALKDDPVFYAFRVKRRDRVEGVASLMEIKPATGSIEIGHINLSPSLQNSIEATEGLFLLMKHAMDDLGYRRFEWKCNALNIPSRSAAARLGFSYEGTFFNHVVVKGRNRDTAWFSILDRDWPAIRANFEAWLKPSNFDANGRQLVSLGDLNRSLK
jgi:RimJ/RimL family protein N-acetyltransferase